MFKMSTLLTFGVRLYTLFAMTLSGFDRNAIIENKCENTCINKFIMENEPFFWFQYQYAQKQGLNLSNTLG